MLDDFLSSTQETLPGVFTKLCPEARKTPSEFLTQYQKHHEQAQPKMIQIGSNAIPLLLDVLPLEFCHDFLEGQREHCIFRALIAICESMDTEAKVASCITLAQSHKVVQKGIVLQACLSQFVVTKCNASNLIRFMPAYIGLSGENAYHFMEIKEEKTKGTQDRIESDLTLISNAQRWMKQAFINLFQNIPELPLSQKEAILVHIAASDICGFIFQSIHDDKLSRPELMTILEKTVEFCFRLPYQQIRQYFLDKLQECRYVCEWKRVKIPEHYTLEHNYNTIGFCYLTLKMVERCSSILTEESVLQYLIPVVGEAAALPFEFRVEILNFLQRKSMIKVRTGIEGRYPIFLMLFKLHYYCKDQYDAIFAKVQFENDQIWVNSLRNLLRLDLPNLNIEKELYVLQRVQERGIQIKESVHLLKGLVKAQNQKNKQKINDFCLNLAKNHKQEVSKMLNSLKACAMAVQCFKQLQK